MRRRQALALGLAGLWASTGLRAAGERLTLVGSDTLAPLCLAWLKLLQARDPTLQVRFQASGSATAVQALLEGAADLGPMSRPMSREELRTLRERHGHPPLAFTVALDAVAVIVHPHNPLRQLPLHSLDAIWSSTRWCGSGAVPAVWGDLGAGGAWARRPIVRHGRNTLSGTFEYFRHAALCGGDFRTDMTQSLASAAVVRAVAQQPRAIGFVGAGHVDDSVRALALVDAAGRAVGPDAEAVSAGDYALGRPLQLYALHHPGSALRPALQSFLALALSPEGQQQVPLAGLIALPPGQLGTQRALLQGVQG